MQVCSTSRGSLVRAQYRPLGTKSPQYPVIKGGRGLANSRAVARVCVTNTQHVLKTACIALLLALTLPAAANAHGTVAPNAPYHHAWYRVAKCETTYPKWNYSGPGYYDGGLQFSPSTWRSAIKGTKYAGTWAYAYQAPAWAQIHAADRWRRMIGGNPYQTAGWPHCGRYWYV